MALGGIRTVLPDADFSGQGLPNISGLFPNLSGRQYASYLFGTGWGWSADGSHDYSGNGRSAILTDVTEANRAATYIAGSSSSRVIAPFTPDDVISSGAYGVCIVARQLSSAAIAHPVSASNSAGIGTRLILRTGQNIFNGWVNDSAGATAAQNTTLSNAADDAWCFYAGTFGTTIRTYARNTGMGAAETRTQVNARSVASTLPFWFGGGRDGTAGGLVDVMGAAVFTGDVSLTEWGTVYDAVQAGLARRGVTL